MQVELGKGLGDAIPSDSQSNHVAFATRARHLFRRLIRSLVFKRESLRLRIPAANEDGS
jgi:hypothetical protein